VTVEKVAILDCGGQYTKVIDRRVRELSVRSDIFPLGVDPRELAGFGGVILSGGPASVWADDSPRYHGTLFDLPVPFLGICYGMHLMNQHFGGVVRSAGRSEYGETTVDVDQGCPLFAGLDRSQRVLMSHGDSVERLADSFRVAGRSRDNVVAAICHEQRPIYGVQFHPEVDLTENGRLILRRFLYGVCAFRGAYRMEDRIEASVEMIRRRVGREQVIVLVSGGVDSAVTAALLVKALEPGQVHAIHVDHGLMRKDESDLVCENLARLGLRRVVRLNAWDDFYGTEVADGERTIGPLARTTDPEEKRRIIGTMFVKVVDKAARDLNLDFDKVFLAQGTLRPDLIESGNPDVSGYAHRIKTHHNDVDLIREARARGRVIETNWDWHKDEVRDVARRLGIDERVASRQPFPGPGLAIRMICTDGKGVVTPQQASGFDAQVAGTGLSGRVVPIKTVGVQGDHRSYRFLALLEAGRPGVAPDWDVLARLGSEIPNRLDFVNRVGFVLDGRLDGAQVFPALLTRPALDLLREADAIVRRALDRPPVSQTFPVLLPFGRDGRFSLAIRAIITQDYMTGRPAWSGRDLEPAVLQDLVTRLRRELGEIDLIAYDVTGKPPATVEWE
jgi:GMP synthase (glutamine-hydrolysing)